MNNTIQIFLVEDEPELVELYRAALQPIGELDIATNAADAIAKLSSKKGQNKANILLLDLIIPKDEKSALDFSERFGFTVLEKIRQLPDYSAMPVFIMTNIDDAEDRVHAQELGALEYIIKSNVIPRDIVERVQAAL